MQGNSNEAMAAAVESSRVILVFLSNAYQKSENCKLEFMYAVSRQKPFVFIKVDAALEPSSWIQPYLNESPSYDIKSVEDLGKMHNNIPRIDCIAQAIRKIGDAQPDDEFDLSDEVFNLKEVLNDALEEIEKTTGQSNFKICTRCQKQYEPDNPIGCKAHRAYYVGGSIIAGRWVCCQQQAKDSTGCSAAPHIDTIRKWTCDPSYGTYTWVPA